MSNLEEVIMEEPNEFKTEFNEAEIKEAEAAIIKGFKKFEYPKLGVVYVRFPTLKEDSEISEYYSTIYYKLLKNTDLPTQKKLTQLLEEKGLWTEKDDEKLESLQNLFTSKTVSIEEIKLKKRKSDEDKANLEQLIIERNTLYDNFVELLVQKNTLLDNCLEKKTEQEVIYFKLIKCVYNIDNTPKWNTLEELMNSSSEYEFDRLIVDSVNLWRGVANPL